MKKIVIFAIGFFMLESLYAQDKQVVVKEKSFKELYEGLLQENNILREQKDQLKKEVDSLQVRLNVYSNRINDLEQLIAQFKKEQTATLQEKDEAIKKMAELVDQIKGEIQTLKEQMAKIEKMSYDPAANELETIKEILELREDKIDNYLKDLEDVKQSAYKLFQDYERLKRELGKTHYNLGNFLFRSGDYAQAAVEYEYASQYIPDDPDVYYNLAVIYDYYMKDEAKALAYYNKYLEKNPNASDSNQVKERIVANQLKQKVK